MQHTGTINLRLRPLTAGLWLALLLAILAGVGTLAFVTTRHSSAPPKPAGIISYADPSGEYTVHPDGARADPVIVAEPLVVQSIFPLSGPWTAPSGAGEAYLATLGDETWMTLRDAAGIHRLAQMAGPGDPPLVAGAKGEAQTADGVPLVAAWSPDGAYLAFGSVSALPYALNITSAQSTTTQQFEVGNDYVGEAAWSHGGRYLAVSSYSVDRSHHTVFIWDRQSGKLSHLIDGCHIVWSPDDRYLVIHRDPYKQPGVSVVSIDGGYVHSLSSDPNAFPSGWVTQ